MPQRLPSCIKTMFAKICCLASEQQASTKDYKKIARSPKKAMLHWLETAINNPAK